MKICSLAVVSTVAKRVVQSWKRMLSFKNAGAEALEQHDCKSQHSVSQSNCMVLISERDTLWNRGYDFALAVAPESAYRE